MKTVGLDPEQGVLISNMGVFIPLLLGVLCQGRFLSRTTCHNTTYCEQFAKIAAVLEGLEPPKKGEQPGHREYYARESA